MRVSIERSKVQFVVEMYNESFACSMSTLNQYSSGGDGSDFSQSFPAGAQYDASTGQYYDPQTGQYYDYAQYYQQYQAEKNSQSESLCTVTSLKHKLTGSPAACTVSVV